VSRNGSGIGLGMTWAVPRQSSRSRLTWDERKQKVLSKNDKDATHTHNIPWKLLYNKYHKTRGILASNLLVSRKTQTILVQVVENRLIQPTWGLVSRAGLQIEFLLFHCLTINTLPPPWHGNWFMMVCISCFFVFFNSFKVLSLLYYYVSYWHLNPSSSSGFY
jgi:hypothetical protein